MTPDEARAELACEVEAWLTFLTNGRADADTLAVQVLEDILARPELVLAALGAESEWEQRAEMFKHQSRQWQERYAKCSDLLSDAEEDAETAEAEVERLNEVVAGMDRELAEWQSRAIAAEAERDRFRRALEQILNASDIEAAVNLAAFALFFPTEEPKP